MCSCPAGTMSGQGRKRGCRESAFHEVSPPPPAAAAVVDRRDLLTFEGFHTPFIMDFSASCSPGFDEEEEEVDDDAAPMTD